MPGARPRHEPGRGFVARDERGDHRVVVLVADEAVQSQQDRRGIGVLERVRAQRVADTSHEARGFHAVPRDVADDDDDAAVGGLERVVPVAADVDVDLGGPVRGRDLHARDHGQAVGNDRRLQQLDDAVLGFETLLARLPQPRAFERRRAAPSEVDRELDVGRRERARVGRRRSRAPRAGARRP